MRNMGEMIIFFYIDTSCNAASSLIYLLFSIQTMNLKQESFLNICKSCDWLCTSFRLALLEGDLDKAIALHATGNVNMVTPFANVKGELL